MLRYRDWLFNHLDGHHRVEIAEKHGLKYKTVVRRFPTEEAKREHVIKLNLCRRQMSEVAWGRAFQQLLKSKGVATGSGSCNDRRTSATMAEIAKECGVTKPTTERRMKAVRDYETLPVKRRAARGEGKMTVAE